MELRARLEAEIERLAEEIEEVDGELTTIASKLAKLISLRGSLIQVFKGCGKARCHCARGAMTQEGRRKSGHGPYWYRSYHQGKEAKQEYYGKELPERVFEASRHKPEVSRLRAEEKNLRELKAELERRFKKALRVLERG